MLTSEDLAIIRKAGTLNKLMIELIWYNIRSGVTFEETDNIAGGFLKGHRAESAFKGYKGYPRNACIFVNDIIVHGIPGNYVAKTGDIVKIDTGIKLGGWNVDAARSYIFGNQQSQDMLLIEAGKAILRAGVAKASAGNSLFDISVACQNEARHRQVFIWPTLGGHYIGKSLHEDPWIPMNPKGATKEHVLHKLQEGDLICLEPIVTRGKTDKYITEPDGWTIRSSDAAKSVQFEHMLLITNKEPEIIC